MAPYWQERLDSEAVGSIAEISKREGMEKMRAHKFMKLARLAPWFVEAIARGQGSTGLSFEFFVRKVLPHEWGQQVDDDRVAAQRNLGFDPRPMRFAGRCGAARGRRRARARRVFRSRWPGWGNLRRSPGKAGGHPGGVCHRPGIAADGLAVHASAPCDLALRRVRPQQGLDRDA